MEHNANIPVVVVTEEKKRRKGALLIAGITAGAIALVGGGTFALWSASGTFDGGEIVAGDLNIVIADESGLFDISSDREDATDEVPGTDIPGHAIDTAWRAVPGDVVAMAAVADVTLVGDNLVAALDLEGLDALVETADYWNWEYSVWINDENVTTWRPLVADVDDEDAVVPTRLAYLATPESAPGNFNSDAVPGVVFDVDDAGTAPITIVIRGEFLSGTAGHGGAIDTDDGATLRDGVNVEQTLTALTFRLSQVRDTGAQFN